MFDYSMYKTLSMKLGDVVFWETLNRRYDMELQSEVSTRHGIFMGIIPGNIHPFDAMPWLKDHAMRRLRISMYGKNKGISSQDRALIKRPIFSLKDGSELLPFFYAAIPCTIFRVIDPETGETISQPMMSERMKEKRARYRKEYNARRKLDRRIKSGIPLSKIGTTSNL